MTASAPDLAMALGIPQRAAERAGVPVAEVELHPIPYDVGSPATAGIYQVVAGDQRWFVKVLRDPRLWPALDLVPEQARAEFLAFFPWRSELDMHRAGLDEVMPAGARVTRLLHVDEPDPEHAVLWTEWIDIDHRPWTSADFRSAGRLLGQLAARRRAGQPINDRLPDLYQGGPNFGLHHYVDNRVVRGIGGDLADDEAWRHPRLQRACGGAAEAVRADMVRLLARIPGMMAELDTLPQTQPHGDASPQNLFLTAAEPGTLIVTDWGFGGYHSIGMDLSQLVTGLAHAGLLDPYRIPDLLELVVDAYTDGLADAGWPQPRELVHRGAVLTVLCRSALTALPFGQLDEVPDAELAARVVLTRVLIGLGSRRVPVD